MNKLKNVWLCALAAAFMVSQAYGQLTTATISGTVTDASGAAIPGASLTLENTTRGAIRTAVSDQSGRFAFDFVQVGSYKLTIVQPGFETGTRSGIDLVSGQVLEFPIQLALQQQSTRVEVTENATPLQTAEAQQVSTLSTAQVHDLPVPHLDWSNLMTLGAGATKPPQTTSNINSSVGSGIVINGLPSAGYNFTVDGTNAGNNVTFPAYNPYQAFSLINAVNNDSIQEVSIAKGTPPAIVGNAVSANINIITKSGTNQFHGTVHELNEVSDYDARNQFLNYKPNTVFNDWGGSIGGPILKNKLFFFGSYEQASLATARPVTGSVPTPYLISIAPAVYAPLFAYFPKVAQPANPTATNATFSGAGSNTQRDHNGVFRSDYYINSNNILAFRYISSHPFAITPALLPANPRSYIGWAENPSVAYTHTSARWTEDTRVAFNNMNENRVDGLLSDPNFGAYSFGWSSGGAKQLRYWGSYTTGQEAVSFVHGRQSIQFGGIVERQIAYQIQYAPTQTVYPNLAAFLANAPSTVNLEAVGDPNSLKLPDGSPAFKDTRFQYGVYIQDDVKVTKNLTLNLGVRYDYFTVPVEGAGRNFNRSFDPNNPGLGPGFGPVIHQYYNPDFGGYQPRIGLAYNLFGRGKTVLRAGFGKMTMGPTFNSSVTNASLPINYALNAAQTKASGLKYPFNSNNYFTEIATLEATGVISPLLTIPGALPLHFPDPYSLQWMFGIQQVLPWRMTLETDYNGNRGLNETTTEMVNLSNRITGVAPIANQGKQALLNPYGGSKYESLQVTLRKTLSRGLTFSSAFTYAKATAVGSDDLLLGVAPQDIYNRSADWGPAVTDIKLRSVTAAQWELPLAKWTHTTGFLSNMLLNGWALSGILSAQSGLPANITNNLSANNVDRPNVCGCGVSPYLPGYQPPGLHQFLNPKAFVAVPLSSLSGEQIADGNLSFDSVYTPGLINVDASLSKTFAITERFRLRIRAETFNTLNHTNLGTLVTTTGSSSFGQLTSATSRSMQVGARLIF